MEGREGGEGGKVGWRSEGTRRLRFSSAAGVTQKGHFRLKEHRWRKERKRLLVM